MRWAKFSIHRFLKENLLQAFKIYFYSVNEYETFKFLSIPNNDIEFMKTNTILINLSTYIE